MERIVVLVALCLFSLAGCGKKDQASEQQRLTNNSSGNPLTAPADYLGAVNQARKSAVRRIDTASLQNAVNLFNAQEDRYPKDLNELADKRYIQAVPEAPAGSRITYNPQTGEIRIVRH